VTKRGSRILLLAAVALVITAGALAAALSGGKPGGNTAGTAITGRPLDTKSPIAVVRAPATQGSRWLTSPAGKLLDSVTTNLGKLTVAGQSARRGAAELLVTDAQAALVAAMPPAKAGVYRTALENIEKAGADVLAGDQNQADTLIGAAQTEITTVTAAANMAAAAAPVNNTDG
jgi:hypothetical protein